MHAKEKAEQVHVIQLEITALIEEYDQVRRSAATASEKVKQCKPAASKEDKAWSKLESKLVESLRRQAAQVGRESEVVVQEIRGHVAQALLDARIAVDNCLQDEEDEPQSPQSERGGDHEMDGEDEDSLEALNEDDEKERQSMWSTCGDDSGAELSNQSSVELLATTNNVAPSAAECRRSQEGDGSKHHEEAPQPKRA